MSKPPLSELDLRYAQLLACGLSPLLSSQQAGWKNFGLEYHRQPAQDIPESNLDHYLINIYLGKPIEVEQWISGKILKDYRTQGDILIAPPGVCPRIRRHQNGEFLVLRLNPTFLTHAVQGFVELEQIQIARQFKIRDPFIYQIGLNLKAELEADEKSSHMYAEAAFNLLSMHLVRRYSQSPLSLYTPKDGLSSQKLRQVLEFIQVHLGDDLSLEVIAHEVGISQSYFSRLFKRSIGISVYQYVMQARIERAIQLLQQNKLGIADIAHRVGFADQSHFTRQFKRLVGITPMKFRNQ